MANGNAEAENFLQLELDSGSDFVDFVGKVFGMRHRRREFASYDIGIDQYDYWPRIRKLTFRDRVREDEEFS